MEELWRDVSGYGGLYQVSNTGRVRKRAYAIMRSNGRKQSFKDKELKLSDRSGYKVVWLCNDGVSKLCRVHRLVAQAFIPNPNNLPFINHKDENPSNNRVENLEWCDNAYNINYGTCKYRMRNAKLGKKLSESHKEHISRGVREAYLNPELHKKLSEAVTVSWQQRKSER